MGNIPKYSYDFQILAEQINTGLTQGGKAVFNQRNLETIINHNYDKTINLVERIPQEERDEGREQYFQSLK